VALRDGSALKVTDAARRGTAPAPGEPVGLAFDPADLSVFPHNA
jgi:hypothetical protein